MKKIQDQSDLKSFSKYYAKISQYRLCYRHFFKIDLVVIYLHLKFITGIILIKKYIAAIGN